MINKPSYTINEKLLPIQTLWVGDELSVMEMLSIHSFIKQGHTVHLYSYRDYDNLPEGCVILDASEILSEDKIFKYIDRDTYSGFSNLFRYKLLLEKGGIWADLDFICLKPFEFEEEKFFATEHHLTRNSQGNVCRYINPNNCFIKTSKECEIMRYCFDSAISRDNSKLQFGETGPALLKTAVEHFNAFHFLANTSDFCPIAYYEHEQFSIPNSISSVESKIRDSYAVHLWNGMWNLYGPDKNMRHPVTSFYGKLQHELLS